MSSSCRVRWNRKNSCVGQRRRAWIAIEPLEKRILLGLLENQFAAEAARQPPRQTGFADTDRAFDDDKAMRRGNGRLVGHAGSKLYSYEIGMRPSIADARGEALDTSRDRERSRVRRDIAQRIQDEIALGHAGMRHGQIGFSRCVRCRRPAGRNRCGAVPSARRDVAPHRSLRVA